MHKQGICTVAVLTSLLGCGAPPEPAAPTPASPPAVDVEEPSQALETPVAETSAEEPSATATTPRARPCGDLVACLKSCEGCDDEHRTQAEKVVKACTKKCPAIKTVKRKAEVSGEFWGFSLGSTLGAARSRCGEIKGVWVAAPEAAHEGTCQAAVGPWGVPVDVELSAVDGSLIRVELIYSYAEGETAAGLLPVFAHLLQQSLGKPTYADTGKRPQYSWMSGTGGTPYRSVLLDDDSRKASIWIQNEK